MADSWLWPDKFNINRKHSESIWKNNQDAFNRLLKAHRLGTEFQSTIQNIYIPLALCLKPVVEKKDIFFLGVHGGQGAGKSTLCFFLSWIMNQIFQLKSVGFSIDDLYLSKNHRIRLAEEISPLLKTRGVPGTHDIQTGLEIFRKLRTADEKTETTIPTFNKATDDKNPENQWIKVHGKPRLVIFEGWCVGSRAQSIKDLKTPLNSLELKEDVKGIWRHYVNRQLEENYQQLFQQLDTLIMLKVPGMEKVLEWRILQEKKLQEACGKQNQTMSEDQIKSFIMHYERVTLHSLKTLPEIADIVFSIGNNHQIEEIK